MGPPAASYVPTVRSLIGEHSTRALLMDLIRPQQERRRDRQAESLGGLEVDHEIKLRRLLHGKVRGLRAFQDLVDVGGGAPEQVRQIWPIGHQATCLYKLPQVVHRR